MLRLGSESVSAAGLALPLPLAMPTLPSLPMAAMARTARQGPACCRCRCCCCCCCRRCCCRCCCRRCCCRCRRLLWILWETTCATDGVLQPTLAGLPPDSVVVPAEKSHVYYGDVEVVVLDEADTMFDRGFGPEVRPAALPN